MVTNRLNDRGSSREQAPEQIRWGATKDAQPIFGADGGALGRPDNLMRPKCEM